MSAKKSELHEASSSIVFFIFYWNTATLLPREVGICDPPCFGDVRLNANEAAKIGLCRNGGALAGIMRGNFPYKRNDSEKINLKKCNESKKLARFFQCAVRQGFGVRVDHSYGINSLQLL